MKGTCPVLFAGAAILAMAACQESTPSSLPVDPEAVAAFAKSAERSPVAAAADQAVWDVMAATNAALEAAGAPYRAWQAEWYAGPGAGADELGRLVFFSDVGNKRLGVDFAPNDPRRAWDSNPGEITYLIDQSDLTTDVPAAEAEAAIDRAMATWTGVTCAALPLRKVADDGSDPDLVDYFLGFGAAGTPRADITHAGWTTAFPPPILGVTFTLIWIDGNGNPTDINHDGQVDAALREIYYDSAYPWAIDGNIDIESVALHESGHGLSQAHFGTAFGTYANGKIHFSPFAVMNAGYFGVSQVLQGSDIAGHCANWGNWPNR
jgi:hypothetical protein